MSLFYLLKKMNSRLTVHYFATLGKNWPSVYRFFSAAHNRKAIVISIAATSFFCYPASDLASREKAKARETEDLVTAAASFFSKTKTNDALEAFKTDQRWKGAHTEIFVIDSRDIVWFMTREYQLTWTSFSELKSIDNQPLLKTMREFGPEGGWVSFLWNQDLVYGYVKNVAKGKMEFIVGAILFEETTPLEVQELVFRARNYYEANGLTSTMEQINNPSGQFVFGSISVQMYDKNGVCLADSFDNNNVDRKIVELKDDRGARILEDFINATEQPPQYRWVEHTINGLKRRTFILRILPSSTTGFYLLTSSYYPDVDYSYVIKEAKKAVEYLKINGTKKALADFSRPENNFYKAHLAVVVYDEKGVIQAHSKYPSLVGINAYTRRDQGNYLVTQNILKNVHEKGKGWTFHYIANAAELIYGESTATAEGKFIVTVQGYTPISPQILSAGIAERICRTLLNSPIETVFNQINFGGSLWSRGYAGVQEGISYGDLFIEIYDKDLFCVSCGFDHKKMWKKIDKGFLSAVDVLEEEGVRGGWMQDRLGFVNRYYYAKRCEKTSPELYYIFVGYTTYGK